jgi:catechol 2,3-dioxygenase-like lactoylglutathione lyase family enzyme
MYIDHVGINTNDMEATLQFYCGILGMRLVRTTRTPDGRRHYNVEIGGGNAFAVFDGAELPTAGERQHVNHLALPVDTSEEFDAAYQRLKDHGVAVTEIIERGYGKTFYFHDPNGIRLQIELKTKQDADSLEGDSDPVPYVRAYAAGIRRGLDQWESLTDAPARSPSSLRTARALNSGQRSSGTLLCRLRTL